MRHVAPLLLLPALALLAACGDDAGEAAATPAAERRPLPVLVHEVGAPISAEPVRAAGTVRLRRETPLAFWTAGRVAAIEVREGDRVRAGQALARLDLQTIDSDVRAARADAARANQELARQKKLIAEGWVTRARLDSAEAGASSARAALDRALFAQKNARIAAPADGIVLARLAEPGQTVASGEPVLVVGEYRAGHVLRVPLAASEVAGLAKGMKADVRFPDGAAPAMAGTIVEVAGRADERTGTFQVEVALPASPALRSGLIGEASIARAPAAEVAAGPLLVPATALFAARAGEAFVWKIDGRGRVAPALVATGAVRRDGVVISAGLAPGDRIVKAGVDRLTAGDPVRPAIETAGTP
jgi:RND family efflux transporter MFP subunit